MNTTISTNLNAFNNYKFSVSALIILTLFALIGNLSVIYIIRRPAFKNISLFRYMIISTTTETISLLFIWTSAFPDLFNINTNEINCKIYGYMSFAFLEIGPLVNAVSSIDRYFSVKYPFRIEIRNKFKFQASVVLCLIFLIFLINIPVFLYLNTSSSPNKKGCGNANYITGFHLILLERCMQLIIPTTIMIITNSLTAYQLILTKKILRRNKFDKEFQYAKFLFSLNFFFIVLNFPATIFIIHNYISKFYLYYNLFGYAVVVFLEKMYSACLFVIYFLINKQFRTIALKFIYCQNKVEPINKTDVSFQMVAIRRE
jgi:hypothetical protein